MWFLVPLLAPLLLLWSSYFPWPLPGSNQLQDLQLQLQKPIPVPIYIKFGDYGFNFPDLVQATQFQLDKLSSSRFNFTLIDKLVLGDDTVDIPEHEYEVELHLANEIAAILDPQALKVLVVYSLQEIHNNDLPYFITQALVDHLLMADLVDYEFDDNFHQVIDIEIVQLNTNVTDALIDVSSNVTDFLTNQPFNFFHFNVDYTIADDVADDIPNNRFYFDIDDIESSQPPINDTRDPRVITFDRENYRVLYDEIYYGLPSIVGLHPQPSNNVKVRMLSMMKQFIMHKLHEKLNFLNQANHMNDRNHDINLIDTIVTKLYALDKDWVEIYQLVEKL